MNVPTLDANIPLDSPERLAVERSLVERIRAGEAAAFGELYDAYAALLFRRVLLPRLGDVVAAEDALSETFRRALERIDTFEPGRVSIYFWLSRIAHNKAMDMHRARRMTGRRLADLQGLLEPLLEQQQGAEQLLELATDASRLEGLVADVLGRIHPRYRRAIELRFFEERDRNACALALEVKVGTFDVVLLRALQAFRKAWVGALSETSEVLSV